MITYAGIKLPCPTPEAAAWIEKRYALGDWLLPYQSLYWPGKYPRSSWTFPGKIPQSPIAVGKLTWPSGAARFGHAAFYCSGEQLDEIRELVFAGGNYDSGDLILRETDQSGTTISTILVKLWMLPPIPLFQCSDLVAPRDQLWLLLLVDARYWWQYISADVVSVTGGTTTWANLYTAAATAIGTSITADAINAAYLKPAAVLEGNYENLGVFLDAVAYNVGQRIVLQFNGAINAYNASTSESRVATNISASASRLFSGGITPISDFAGDLPGTITISFPVLSDGVPTGAVTTKSASYSGDAATNPHRKVFHDTAAYDGSNDAELQALTDQFAADWYIYQSCLVNATYAGLVSWLLEGQSDTIEYVYRKKLVCTRVSSLTANDLTEELLHYGASGTGAVIVTEPIYYKTTIFFPATGSAGTAPVGRLVLPTLDAAAPPTYPGYGGEVICDGKNLWQSDGTSWYGYVPVTAADYPVTTGTVGGIPTITATGTFAATPTYSYTPSGGEIVATESGTTNTAITAQTLTATSTGTPTAGFGLRELIQLESDTQTREASRVDTLWTDPADATRTSEKVVSLVASGTTVETLRLQPETITLTSTTTETNSTVTALTKKADSTGTPSAGFGLVERVQLDSDTVEDRTVSQTAITWTDATDATRTVSQTQTLTDYGGTWIISTTTTGGSAATLTHRLVPGGGAVSIGGGVAASELQFKEPSAGGTSYVGFKAPALAGDTVYTLPDDFPDGDGYVLASSTLGVMSWVSILFNFNELTLTDVDWPDLAPIWDVSAGENRVVTVERFGGFLRPSTCEGRLTALDGTPLPPSDVTGATSIYFTQFEGNRVALYDGTRWNLYALGQVSLSLSVTIDKNYDVFLYDDAGTLTLELSAAWTNDTTRADALNTVDDVWVLAADTTRRWVGTIRASAANTTEDSAAKRFVWNAQNRRYRKLKRSTSASGYTYSTNTLRQTNAASAERVEVVVGEEGDPVDLTAISFLISTVATVSVSVATGIGYDSTTTDNSDARFVGAMSTEASNNLFARMVHSPGIGYHAYNWLERGLGSGTQTWYPQNGGLIGGYWA